MCSRTALRLRRVFKDNNPEFKTVLKQRFKTGLRGSEADQSIPRRSRLSVSWWRRLEANKNKQAFEKKFKPPVEPLKNMNERKEEDEDQDKIRIHTYKYYNIVTFMFMLVVKHSEAANSIITQLY